MSDTILQIKALSKSFPGVKALDNVSIDFKKASVHALMGENGAGKSTLMKCIFGIYNPDEGDIIYDGVKVKFKSSRDALKNGISMIHQELNPVPYRTVAENIFLGNYIYKKFLGIKIVDDKKINEKSKALIDELGFKISEKSLMKDLSVSQMQAIEIVKAVSHNAKVIIMDEPTSSLTDTEVEQLFTIIKKLKSQGISIIYISHKMEEILKISDEVSIMRDGKYVGTWLSKELTTDIIISKMVGRELSNRFPEKTNQKQDKEVLKVENVTSINPKSFKNVSFKLYKGEILGFAGLVGAQRTETLESIFGLRKMKEGSIYINGRKIKIRRPKNAIYNKIALLTEDRRSNGIFPVLSVLDNTVISSLENYKNGFYLSHKKEKEATIREINKLKTKTPSHDIQIRYLSGGNQQKVIFSRWILNNPDVLVLDEPTRGIDVGAKYEIYNIIISLAKSGKSIIVISSEMPELLGITDRIIVMCNGRITADLETSKTNQEEIMNHAFQFS